MFPFHKIYLYLFSSLDFDVERKLLLELKNKNIKQFLSIKRSWIYALKISFIAYIGILLLLLNAGIWMLNFDSFFAKWVLPISYVVVALVLFYDTIWYIWSYKKTHKESKIEVDIDEVIRKNDMVNKNFIKFFNISVFVSFSLIIILLETVIFILFFYSGDNMMLIGWEAFLNLIAWICIFKHRRLSMNLELDFWLVVPWNVYIIDQTGLLSSKQSVMAQNIKTIEGAYNSIFASLLRYGDIKIFLEWNIPQEKGIITLDYAKTPRKTIDLMNNIL